MVSGCRGAIVVQYRVSEAKQTEECPPGAGRDILAWVLKSKKGKSDVHMGRQWPNLRSQRTSQVRRTCVCMHVEAALPTVWFSNLSEGWRTSLWGETHHGVAGAQAWTSVWGSHPTEGVRA